MRHGWMLAAVLLFACDGSGELDAGVDDAGTRDGGGAEDSGTPRDAAPLSDGGLDAGGHDAGGRDAGELDAGSPRAVPDPMLLPEASGQRAEASAPDVAPGSSYLDPISSVRVWRVTGPSTPQASSEAHHDYANGGTQISHRLDASGAHTLLVYLAGVGHRLVDFTPGAGFSRWREPAIRPRNDVSFTFSHDPSTPHVAYVVASDGRLHRIDTRDDVVSDGGAFPAPGFGQWLQQDVHDRWFVALTPDGDGVVALDTDTGRFLERSFANLDEPYLERDGATVMINVGGTVDAPLWDLESDTVRTASSATRVFHAGSLRGFWTAADVDIGGGRVPYHRVRASSGGSEHVLDYIGYQSLFHMAGQWIQGDLDAPPGVDQWALLSFYGGNQSGGPLMDRAIGFFRLDGEGGFRFLAHSYTSNDGEYWHFPRATISPDGELVMFDANPGGGRGDVFLVEVPTRPAT